MNNPGVKNGLFYGAAACILYLLLYLISKRLIFSVSIGLIFGVAVPIFFMVMAARQTRSNQEGIMSFGEGLTATFVTYVLGSFIATIFTYVMSNVIDPSLLVIEKEEAMSMMENMFSTMGAPEDQLDLVKESIEDSSDVGLGMTLAAWAFTLIIPGFIYAAITSAIMKKDVTA